MLPSTSLEVATWRSVSPCLLVSLLLLVLPCCVVLCWLLTLVVLLAAPWSVDRKLEWKAAPKIPTAKEAAKHKAGGGNVEICELITLHTPLQPKRA